MEAAKICATSDDTLSCLAKIVLRVRGLGEVMSGNQAIKQRHPSMAFSEMRDASYELLPRVLPTPANREEKTHASPTAHLRLTSTTDRSFVTLTCIITCATHLRSQPSKHARYPTLRYFSDQKSKTHHLALLAKPRYPGSRAQMPVCQGPEGRYARTRQRDDDDRRHTAKR